INGLYLNQMASTKAGAVQFCMGHDCSKLTLLSTMIIRTPSSSRAQGHMKKWALCGQLGYWIHNMKSLAMLLNPPGMMVEYPVHHFHAASSNALNWQHG
ncbi:MAG: hypothetical protein ACOH1Q_11160, partial [Thiobacillus sp.]